MCRLATRTLEQRRDRTLTILLIPFSATLFYQAGTYVQHPISSTAWIIGISAALMAAEWSFRLYAKRRAAHRDSAAYGDVEPQVTRAMLDHRIRKGKAHRRSVSSLCSLGCLNCSLEIHERADQGGESKTE